MIYTRRITTLTSILAFSALFSQTIVLAGEPLPQMFGDALTASSFAHVLHNGRGLIHDFFGGSSDGGAFDPFSAEDAPLPASPKGSQLVQFNICKNTPATIPLFVTDQWNGSSTVTTAYINQHGSAHNPSTYFKTMYPYMGQDDMLIAPGFFSTKSKTPPEGYYQPSINLAWGSNRDTWPAGQDAISPLPSSVFRKRSSSSARSHKRASSDSIACSSYEGYEAILNRLDDKSLFPNLQKVVIVGHSGGANMISRYSQLNTYNGHLHLRFVIINAANQAYFTSSRPWLATDENTCEQAFNYPYQWTTSNMPRWVKGRFNEIVSGIRGTNAKSMKIFTEWSTKDIFFLTGNADTNTDGGQSCQDQSQGGPYRRNRNFAYWAYTNLLAGSQNSPYPLNDYFGFGNLTQTGTRRLDVQSPSNFIHQSCIVNGVGHNEPQMLRSDCGHSALFDDNLPAGENPADSPPPVQTSSSDSSDSSFGSLGSLFGGSSIFS